MPLRQRKVNQVCLLYSEVMTGIAFQVRPLVQHKNNRKRLFGACGYFDFL